MGRTRPTVVTSAVVRVAPSQVVTQLAGGSFSGPLPGFTLTLARDAICSWAAQRDVAAGSERAILTDDRTGIRNIAPRAWFRSIRRRSSTPRYFYNIDGLGYPDDEEGVTLDDPMQARDMAVTHAGEMLQDVDGKFWGAPAWRMVVTDEQGVRVCSLRIQGWGDTKEPDA